MKNFLQKNWFVILFALAVSMLYGGGHLLQIRQLGWQRYEPITVAADPDPAVTYFPRAKAAYEGHWLVGDTNLLEYEKSPLLFPALPPIIMGLFGRLVGSMKLGVILSDFLFPPAIFILFYIFIFEVTGRKLFSLFVSVLFIFAPDMPFWGLRELRKPPLVSFPFSRFDYPKMTMPFYLLAAYFSYRTLRERRPIYEILGGIFFGALFYTYLYDWVTFSVGLCLLLLYCVATRDFAIAKRISGLLGLGLTLSIPYWINFYHLTALPQYHDIIARAGVEISHGIRFLAWPFYVRVGAVGLLVYWALRARDRMLAMYFIAFLATLFVTLNLQVVTGINPQPDHWLRTLEPFLYLSFAVAALWIGERYAQRFSPRHWAIGGAVVIVCLFSLETFYVVRLARIYRSYHTVPEEAARSYQWLEENTPPKAVIASVSPAVNFDLQLYTRNKLFLPFGVNTVASNEEIWQRFFYLVRMYRIPENRVRAWLFGQEEMPVFFKNVSYNRQAMILYLFVNAFYPKELNTYFTGSTRVIPLALVDEKMKEYFTHSIDRSPFEADYIYFGPQEKALGATDPAEHDANLKRVYEDGQVRIYKL